MFSFQKPSEQVLTTIPSASRATSVRASPSTETGTGAGTGRKSRPKWQCFGDGYMVGYPIYHRACDRYYNVGSGAKIFVSFQ